MAIDVASASAEAVAGASVARRRISTNAVAALATNALRGGLGFAASVLLARALGPSGRGQFALATTAVLFVVLLAGLGMSSALIRAKAKLTRSPEQLYGAAAGAGAITGLLGTAGFLVAYLLLRQGLFQDISAWEAGCIAVMVVPQLVISHWGVVAYLEDRIIEFGIAVVSGPLAFLVSVAVAATAGLLSPSLAVTLWGIASFLPLGTFVALRRGLRLGAPRALVFELLRFSLRANIAVLALILVWRVDVFLVSWRRGIVELGLYTVAVSVAEVILQAGVSIRVALTPMQGASHDRDRLVDLICRVTRLLTLGGIGAVVVGALVAQPAMHLVFGGRFDTAAPALAWLLPGVLCLVLQGQLVDYLITEGHVVGVSIATVAAVVVNVGIDVTLLRDHTFLVAAISSTTAYLIAFLATASLFTRVTGRSWASLLLPRPSDLPTLCRLGLERR